MDSTTELVVKVNHGGVLRRFRVPVKANGQLDLGIADLREKIASLFNLPADAEFSLNYTDEDGDMVALVDDDDLFDVASQRLKFLKINLVVRTNSATPVSNETSSIQKGINDVLMAVPNPMRETISKVCTEFASNVASSSPVVGELLDCVSKLGQLSKAASSSPFYKPGSSREVPKDVSEKKTQTSGFANPKTSGHVPASSAPGASFNECPFSGASLNDSCANPNPAYHRKHERPNNDGDSLGVFHKGVQCDGCGVLPITGPRFKSIVEEDYDLCNICFSVIGNMKDYTRMDKPVSVQHLHPFRGPFSHPVGRRDRGLLFRSVRPKLDSRFVLDVNVFDGTVVAPSTRFTKIWRMKNNGSLVWPRGTRIVWIGGDRFSVSLSVDLQIPEQGVPVHNEGNVKVDFVAPESPGRYISYWRMASPNGAKFGQRVWVLINVDASLKKISLVNEFHGLNLNDSPAEDYESAQPGSSNVNPGTVEGAESKILEKEDLLVGEVDAHTPSSSTFNVIRRLENSPMLEEMGGGSSSTKEIPVPLEEGSIEKNAVEETRLKELEEMGFKEIDLNKEVLRDNGYDLEQSVEALCGVSEWDPILEELQEMGFCDDVTNKRLLKKNNGSIKGVVMDLVTGEKEA